MTSLARGLAFTIRDLIVGISNLVNQYMLPAGLAIVLMLAALVVLAVLAQRGIAPGVWRVLRAHPLATPMLILGLAFTVPLITNMVRNVYMETLRQREKADLVSVSNLIPDPLFTSVGSITTTLDSWVVNDESLMSHVVSGRSDRGRKIFLGTHGVLTSSLMLVHPGETYRYSFYIGAVGERDLWVPPGEARVRLLWLDKALNVILWNDTLVETDPDSSEVFHTDTFKAPSGARGLRLVVSNLPNDFGILLSKPKLSQQGIYIEPHPNGAQGALAFSFDWESAMGGAIHSKGMATHDPKSAAEHGQAMRDGADWLNTLFKKHDIRATFYATGYNLLDGNTERHTFSGNPTYKWANRKNGWDTDWWSDHSWFGDDPYGTTQTDPAWYFGDQTRTLLQAGHEIAPHTFGHLYVRGAKTEELATDMDEWLSAAKSVGVQPPTTFAFPWRSSNSLTADFYKVLWDKGIRAVTRVYPSDMKDLYTVGATVPYPDIAVMPDFLLGAESAIDGEGAGRPVSGDEGLKIINETLNRRGTTSFWQHPEQLASNMNDIRDAWEKVVSAAADERDKGRLWVDTVANITAYQRDIMSITATLDKDWLGGWKIHVNNALDKPLSGVTLTLPGDTTRISSSQADLRTVYHPEPGITKTSDAGNPIYPARQIVLHDLKPGAATIEVEWAAGQEPIQ